MMQQWTELEPCLQKSGAAKVLAGFGYDGMLIQLKMAW